MKRFIFVSFAFLAWVFYELSDGADFQPPEAMGPTASETVVVASTTSAKARPVKAATLIASPAINSPEPPKPAALPTIYVPVNVPDADPDIKTVAQLDQIRTSLNQGLSLFQDSGPVGQQLTLASLDQGAAGLATVALPEATPKPEPVELAAPVADIREITGTRVNMRDGPGTIYPVVIKLTIGHRVEVLGDSGTGWLRLRTLPNRQIGWISASLVSKGKP